MAGMVLAVDMAISPDGKRVAFVSAGNATNTSRRAAQPALTRVFVTDTDSATDDHVGCKPDGKHGPCGPGFVRRHRRLLAADEPAGGTGTPAGSRTVTGAAGHDDRTRAARPRRTAAGHLRRRPIRRCRRSSASRSRSPSRPTATSSCSRASPRCWRSPGGDTITLSTVSRADTGHLLFHANAGGFIACASCHAEGNDDGRVWNFTCQGARRTQSLQVGGLRGTEPFHWGGDETDITRLMKDVFVGRMSGPVLATDQIDALMTWIDAQPRVPRSPPAGYGRRRARAGAVQRSDARGLRVVPRGRHVHEQRDRRRRHGRRLPGAVAGRRRDARSVHAQRLREDAARIASTRPAAARSHGNIRDLTRNEIADLVAYLQSI